MMKNKTKLVSTKEYLLFVEKEPDLKINDYAIFKDRPGICKITNLKKERIEAVEIKKNISLSMLYHSLSNLERVIAHYPLTKEAKELDLPLLPEFKNEVNIEDVKDQARDLFKKLKIEIFFGKDISEIRSDIEERVWAYCEGYKAAQAKQFSLEDVKKAIKMAQEESWDEGDYLGLEYEPEEIIQSLSTQQLPKDFECQMYPSYPKYDGWEEDDYDPIYKPMTITNSDGKKVLTGEYKY